MKKTVNWEAEIDDLQRKLLDERKANEKSNDILQLLEETSKAITSEVELEKLVQRITDKATELSGAQFGAFFYNVERDEKEYLLYTISGVPKEKFSCFPLPRVTKIFAPTFEGKCTVRYDDVTQQPHFGKNSPYHGMPKGHLPVRSYLAVPVISPITKEVIGGLFLGHSDAGVFTEKEQKIVEGISLQGAIAMGNAKLFEEKRLAEISLTEQRELYKNILNSTFDSILILDDKGVIVEASAVAAFLFEKAESELTGKNIKELLVSFDPRFLNTRTLGDASMSFQTQGTRTSGKVVDIECRARLFSYKDAPHILVVLRDITDHLRAENDLKKSQKFSQIISESSPVVLWLTNDAGELHYINSLWCRWTGAELSEHYGFGWMNFIHQEDRQEVKQQFRKSFEKKQALDLDFRIVGSDGNVRVVNMRAEPFQNYGNFFSGIAGSIMDITEKKRIQMELSERHRITKEMLEAQVRERTIELETMNEELLQFTRIASHDLKEPVRKVSIFARMLRDEVQKYGTERELKRLDNIISSGDRMMHLITDLLSFSRLSNTDRRHEQVDLNSVVGVVLDDLQLSISEKNAQIEVSRLPLIEGSSVQLGQVFQNLFSNSLKFSDPLRPLKIHLTWEKMDGKVFRLSYSDTGIGFNSKFSEKIFEVFQRLHTREQYEGTGMGLSIVKKIITQHQGTISAKGHEGVGAQFEIILPYKQLAHIETDAG